jgi:uncharacterized protein
MASTLQPLSQTRRDITLDILRGFALAGVLFMFCVSDNGPLQGYTNSFWDELIAWPKYILIESRMYTMLIIIFGIGFHVQLEKAKKQGASLVPVFSRRLIGLLLLGFIHATLLSSRDILMFYAIAGSVLLMVRKATTRQLLLFMAVLFYVIVPLIQYNVQNTWPQVAALVEPDNYPAYIDYNWQYFKLYHQVYFIYIEMLFHFMLGFVISKAGILLQLKADARFRRKMFRLSLAGAIVLIPLLYFWSPEFMPRLAPKINSPLAKLLFSLLFRTTWQFWMIASVTLYTTILISLSSSSKGMGFFKPLAAFGQMALSNYLVQSLVLVPWLLINNNIRKVAPAEGFILFLVVLALQLLFSNWWLRRYKLGPFEWLLRSFTYWRWQKIKKPPELRLDEGKQLITVSAR